ncbi:MAG: glycosyltransferase, partial [Lachnospiraceae bacterium]|nr:glycosyltransferase [Lachnospiraceae bacterium]
MKLTFVSNYFNHHQRSLCEAFARTAEVDFVFLQTEPMEEERVRMGWALDASQYPYVCIWQDDAAAAEQLVQDSEIVIWGGVEAQGPEAALEARLQERKLTFRYSERIYKEGQWKFISPRGLKQKYHDYTQYRKAPYYLLCAGAYVGSDFKLVHAFPKKKFVWGYFPEVKQYDVEELFAKKSKAGEPVRILWAGRMIDWKHPELAIDTAEALLHGEKHLVSELPGQVADAGGFVLTMAGGGELEGTLRRQVQEKGLSEVVRFTGFLKPEEIRAEMERSDIFLFTSDEKEGWGAVLNEAMNSGCMVIARPEIG